MDNKTKVYLLLLANGWKYDNEDLKSNDGFVEWRKEGFVGVDINEDEKEMVFISDEGDFLHEKLNYYALLGVLITMRQITFNFKSI